MGYAKFLYFTLGNSVFSLICLVLFSSNSAAQYVVPNSVSGTITFRVENHQYEGRLLHWTQDEIFLLQGDGSLSRVNRVAATGFRAVSSHFTPLSAEALRSQLLREYGRDYTVDATTHYLIVRPIGKGESWKEIFESTYRNVQRFAAQRRLPIQNAEFPLIAVVLGTQDEFMAYLSRVKKSQAPSQTLGCYDPVSNRVVTFASADRGSPRQQPDRVESLPNVIRHEAFHQAAANTALVNRFADVPLWFHEGMALMFENEFINPLSGPREKGGSPQKDLKIQAKLVLTRQPSGWLREVVLSDSLFLVDPRTAYSLSWALVSYLNEKHHRSFVRYLTTLNRLAPFESLSSEKRRTDFTDAFGDRWDILESAVLTFVNQM